MSINKIFHVFKQHPTSVGETYLQHLWECLKVAGRLFLVSVAILIHGLFPFVLTFTASNKIAELHDFLQSRQKMGNKN